MKIVVTGAAGFLGWHTRCLLRARGFDDVQCVDRQQWLSTDAFGAAVTAADVVLHFAGSNRAESNELRNGNLRLAKGLTDALDARATSPAALVYANSIHAGNGSAFGDGKAAAASHLLAWGAQAGVPVVDVRLPNLFGEHGRPHYNSVVATFCHELANGGRPLVKEDRQLPLLHAQDAAAALLDAGLKPLSEQPPLRTTPLTVSSLLNRLIDFRDTYATGDIPDVSDPFALALFNTYRSYLFPAAYPIHPQVHSDRRGGLFEAIRVHGGQSHVFCSTTLPGFVRGQHFHLRKIERFLVIRGSGEISLRRMFTNELVQFNVSSDQPAVVDMPTMWAHSIANTGQDELVTLFWAHEILDMEDPDTYPESVEQVAVEDGP